MHSTADLIKSLRAKGLTQSEISRRTRIPQPRISRWERGDAPESADDALRLHALEREVATQIGDEVVRPTQEAKAA